MTLPMNRRQFLAAAAALAAAGRRLFATESPAAPPPHPSSPRGPVGNAPALAGDAKLFLPTTSGESARFRFAATPAWARDNPGWFVPDTLSGGSCLLDFLPRPEYRVARLKSFSNLPTLLTEARSLGTEAIYLVDWYEGRPGQLPRDYWTCKGDYVPRLDLGGEAALKAGIAALHAQGGKIILYVEGFIIDKESEVGKQHGAQWSILRPSGPLAQPYAHSWKPCPAAAGWVTYFESVAHRIAQYGTDGIFIDSYGYQKDWKCVSRAHRHPLGSSEVFNNGALELVRRVRAALHSVNPEAVILTEGPILERLFEQTDGSLDWGIHSLVHRWLWDAQGRTDTVTTGLSLDDWHQILAIGAKLACPSHFLEAPPHSSAVGVLDAFLKKDLPDEQKGLRYTSLEAFRNLHQWRNAGLILGLPMPGLADLCPREGETAAKFRDPMGDLFKDRNTLRATLERLRPRAAAIDAALAGREAPAPTAYLKDLLTARRRLAPFIDHGSTVARVNSRSPQAAGWRFTSPRGMALTAVNVADAPCHFVFPNAPGTWVDAVNGEKFEAQGTTLTVAVPAHGLRLLHGA